MLVQMTDSVANRYSPFLHTIKAGLNGSVGCASDWWSEGYVVDLRWVWQHFLAEIDLEIFSTVILSLPLIQQWQLSVSGESAQALFNSLEVWPGPEKSVVR